MTATAAKRSSAAYAPVHHRADADAKIRSDISASETISRERETELVTAWKEKGCIESRNALVESHQRLVAGMASRFARSGASFADLFNEGMIALMSAANKFDTSFDCRFSSYASWWILSEMQNAMHREIYSVKIGRSRAERRALSMLSAARQMLGPNIDATVIGRISELTGIKADTIFQVDGAMASRSISLNATLGEDGAEFGDTIEDGANAFMSGEICALRGDQKRLLKEMFLDLSDRRAATILTEKWLSDEEKSLKDIGVMFGVSAERIRQIEREALNEIRRRLAARGLTVRELIGM
jgi:RNA polymerase sigma-32 factor